MTEARRHTPLFVMPHAECLALVTPGWQAGTPEHEAVLQRVAGPLEGTGPADACALLSTRQGRDEDLPDEQALDCHLSDDPHDTFFRIARSADPAQPLLLGAALQSLQLFIAETTEPCERADYADLEAAIRQVVAELLEGETPPPPQAEARPAPVPLMRASDPLRRWLRGHQIFAVLTQGLIRRLHRVVAAVDSGEVERLSRHLQAMATLYRASALAFRFTSDFDPEVYASVIRPSMCEPYTPKGFSGTLSSDHGILVKLLVGHREALAAAAGRCPQEYTDMRQAIAAVYDDHKYVCARFDGDRSPSLRSSSMQGQNTAVDMLERFRSRRIAMLP